MSEKKRQSDKKWRAENPEKVKEYRRKFMAEHPGYMRRYYDRMRENNARWQRENSERVNEYKRKWRMDHPEKVKEYDQRAKLKKRLLALTSIAGAEQIGENLVRIMFNDGATIDSKGNAEAIMRAAEEMKHALQGESE